MNEIWVAGYPSFYGGAGVELDHQVDLWRSYGVDVHLVPTPKQDPSMRTLCDARGCVTHTYEPKIFKDKLVVSFCNGAFLERLPEIYAAGAPRAVVWLNCMTWLFPKEIEAHKQGWITHFGFQTGYQRRMIKAELEQHRPVQELEGYRPYFSPGNRAQDLRFDQREPRDYFGYGRISRDDSAKFSPDMWRIFDRVLAPKPKKVFILGYGQNAKQKTGDPPKGLDWMWWAPEAIPVSQFYPRIHCLIHKTGGSRENYPRVLLECWQTGVVPVVEDDYGFPELVEDGVTGLRCRSSDEMSFRASQLAFDEEKRTRMTRSAHEHLTNEIGSRERCWPAWERILRT